MSVIGASRRVRGDGAGPPPAPGDGRLLGPSGLRLLTGAAAVACLLALVLGGVVEALALSVCPGLALCLLAGVRSAHRLALYTVTLSPALLILLATVMARLRWWHPGIVAPLWLVLALAALIVVWFRIGPGEGGSAESRQPLPRSDWAMAGCIVAGWLIAVGTAAVRHGDPRPEGMAISAGPVWFAGFALILLGLLWSVLRSTRLLPLAVLAISSVTVAAQAAMYAMPTVVVAARHVGIGEYLDAHGQLLPAEDIYQAWAGLFAGTALITRAAGIAEPFDLATWWPVIAAPAMALAIRAVAGRFLDSRRAWLAALVFALGNSLNTTFYAPQVFGFLAGFTLIALLVTDPEEGGRRRVLRYAAALALSCAVAVTHQLSPYMITLALLVLVLTRLVRPWWVALIPPVPALLWLGINHTVVARYISPAAFGRIFQNLAPPSHPTPPIGIPLINRLTFELPALALALIGLLALWRLWRGRRERLRWALALTAASPVALMAGTDYGSEGIFRVALFALPWLAVLAVTGPTRDDPEPTPVRELVTALALLALAGVNLLGLTGMDWARVIRRDDVAVVRYFERTAPDGAALVNPGSQATTPIALTGEYLSKQYFSRETVMQYFRPDEEIVYPLQTGTAYDAAADLRQLTEAVQAAGAPAYYMFVSDSTAAYNYRYGLQRPADYEKLCAALARSPDWELVDSSGNSRLYRLRIPQPG